MNLKTFLIKPLKGHKNNLAKLLLVNGFPMSPGQVPVELLTTPQELHSFNSFVISLCFLFNIEFCSSLRIITSKDDNLSRIHVYFN